MTLAAIHSSLIIVFTFGVLALARASAATRHAVLTAGLVASLAVPFLGFVLPKWSFAFAPPIAREKWRAETVVIRDAPINGTGAASVPVIVPPELPAASAADTIFRIWIGGSAVAAFGLIAGVLRVRRLAYGSETIAAAEWTSGLQRVFGRMGLKRRVRLLQNRRAILGAWGILRPIVFIPGGAVNWPEERIRVVLTHELAHVKRFDALAQFLSELAVVAYWFNPLVWILRRRLRLESECACDDIVLNSGFSAGGYAAELLDIARSLRNSGRSWSRVLAMSGPSDLERRFAAMFSSTSNRSGVSRRVAFVIAIAAAGLACALAAVRVVAQPEEKQPAPSAAVKVEAPRVAAASATPVRPAAAVRSKSPVRPPAPPAAPQGLADGAITGTVSDSTGAVIPGVLVSISVIEPGTAAGLRENPVGTLTSDETGQFDFPALAAGRYELRAELPGFAAYRKSLEIMPNVMVRENVRLSIGRIVNRVQVTAAGQPRPAPTPGTPHRIRVGGNIAAPRLISQVRPEYPQSARDAGIEGNVHLQGVIGTEGSFIALWVVSSNNPELANAALEAVRQWQYSPTLLNGVPVPISTDVDVDFKLAN